MLRLIRTRQMVPLTFPTGFSRKLSTEKIFNLNDLQNRPGAIKKRRRWGRGIGSGRGKLCGFGHQKSRSTPRAFEGGQTPIYKRHPKFGFKNFSESDFEVVNLNKIQEFIDMGRLVPNPTGFMTIRDLLASGLITNARSGVKVLAKGKVNLRSSIHLEVNAASASAIESIESVGGTVTAVHFNKLALRALIQPFKYELLPQRARPPPKLMSFYLDRSKCGYLSPEIQIRNLKLFGHVTSEEILKQQHDAWMSKWRASLA